MKNHRLDAHSVLTLALQFDLELPLAPTAAPVLRPRPKGPAPNARKTSRQKLYRDLREARRLADLDPAWIGEAFRNVTGRWPRGYRTGEALR